MVWQVLKSGSNIACLCEYRGDIKALLGKLKGYRNGSIMQAFSCRDGVVDALLPAYINARLRASEGIARANDINMDFMLLVARTMKIEKALAEYGAAAPRFIFFSERRSAGLRFLKKHGVKVVKELKLSLRKDMAEGIALSELLEK